jgi:hypothetical protein
MHVVLLFLPVMLRTTISEGPKLNDWTVLGDHVGVDRF